MGNHPPSASGPPGHFFVTMAQLNGRQALAAGMGNLTVQLFNLFGMVQALDNRLLFF